MQLLARPLAVMCGSEWAANAIIVMLAMIRVMHQSLGYGKSVTMPRAAA
jgi:hypothetical protein